MSAVRAGRRTLRRAEEEVRAACAEASSTRELLDALRAGFTGALGASGQLIRATDPETTMFATAAVIENLPDEMCIPWMHNEFLEDDFNKFSVLHSAAEGVGTLHRVTQGSPHLSPRHARVNTPHGFGPELRATFSTQDGCWGVANLLREAGDPDFDEAELAWLEGLRVPVAAALRRRVAITTPAEVEDPMPGVVTLAPDGAVLSATENAVELLGALRADADYFVPGSRLPCEAYSVALIARAHAAGRATGLRPVNRVQSSTGRWLTIRGDSTLSESGELINIVLVVEPSRSAEIMPLAVAGYGLTGREQEVVSELAAGRTTGEIATRLFISEHTVRDHVKSILAKTGCSSRGELVSRLFHR